MAKKRGHGHFCWVCGCVRSNESFSGGGHRRHVCGQCARLGPARLEALQTIRNVERELRGRWRRNHRIRGRVEALLNHPALEVRAFAIDMLFGPFLYVGPDGEREFAWVHFVEDDLDWDGDESEWTDRMVYEDQAYLDYINALAEEWR